MPPETRSQLVTDTYHGVSIDDPFRWLEGDTSDPARMGLVTDEVEAWTTLQNGFTRTQLDSDPRRESVEAALRPLLEIGTVSAPIVRSGRWFYSRRDGAQDQPSFYWRDGAGGVERHLIDPHQLDSSGLTVVEWISPSHDGKLVAYGCFRSGDEDTTLHLLEVESGVLRGDSIGGKVQAPDWLPDGSGFVYRNLRDRLDPYSAQVMFHRLGTSSETDRLLFRQKTRAEDEALATTWGPFAKLSHDGRSLLLGYWIDTQSADAWVVDFESLHEGSGLLLREVSVGTPGTIDGHVVGDLIFFHTTKGAPNGRVVVAPVASPGERHWRSLIAERSDAVIEAVRFSSSRIAVTYLKNATTRIEVFDFSGHFQGDVPLPGLGSASIRTEPDRSDAYVTFESFNFPVSVFQVDLSRPGDAPTMWAATQTPIDSATVAVEQVWYSSADGTRVSMFLVRPKTARPDGAMPCLVTGYGGFNISVTPAFVPSWYQWLDAGGMLAIPNLRGGGEYGDAWHAAGMREHKQNVFDDFFSAIEWLIGAGWTRPAKVAVSGGSNGGLLAGVTVTQRPDLCRAAIVAVPLLDMLRYQHFLMARYWVPEYGSSEEPDMFPALLAYSPYHHVEAGRRYPAVFLTAGENDTRVHPMHARKMAAALQRAAESFADARRVLLWVDREAGHGQGKPLKLRLRELVDQRLFLMEELGMFTALE